MKHLGSTLKRHTQLLRCFLEDESGSELVEFAVSSILLFTVIFGILATCQALYADHYVAHAAREASRYAMVRGSSWQGTSCATTLTFSCAATATDVSNFVISITPLGFVASGLTVSTTWPGNNPLGTACASANGNNSPGCVVAVNVTYAYDYLLPFATKTTLSLQSTSTVAISR